VATVAVTRERHAGETRVALTPDAAKKLIGLGLAVVVEAGAGIAASCSDAEYESAGARIADAGFRIRDVEGTGMPYELAMPALARPPWRAPVLAFANGAARIWPTLFGYQFIVEAERP